MGDAIVKLDWQRAGDISELKACTVAGVFLSSFLFRSELLIFLSSKNIQWLECFDLQLTRLLHSGSLAQLAERRLCIIIITTKYRIAVVIAFFWLVLAVCLNREPSLAAN